jgi:hypothetical protein
MAGRVLGLLVRGKLVVSRPDLTKCPDFGRTSTRPFVSSLANASSTVATLTPNRLRVLLIDGKRDPGGYTPLSIARPISLATFS